MAIKSYILKQDYKSPSTSVRQIPNRPPQVCSRMYRKGEVVQGEIKHINNKPEILIVKGGFIFPISVIKELVTKEVISDASGESAAVAKPEKSLAENIISPAKNTKVKYLDALIVGAILGAGGAYLAEKQGWIPTVDKKNKLYGAAIGAALFFYLAYRHTQNAKSEPKTKE